MVLIAVTKIIQGTNSSVQYVATPVDVAKNSQYQFSQNEDVGIQIMPDAKELWGE